MTTAFALLLDRCGLSQREAADFLDCRLDTVKNWSSGRRGANPGVIARLQWLYARIEAAAAQRINLLLDTPSGIVVELVCATDDVEARWIGWPCVGVQLAYLGLVLARAPEDCQLRLVIRLRDRSVTPS